MLCNRYKIDSNNPSSDTVRSYDSNNDDAAGGDVVDVPSKLPVVVAMEGVSCWW